jgi:uncharacterized membrane protein YoaK (UPF0700 family)
VRERRGTIGLNESMFRHQGPGRSDRQNSILAAYLATVAGFVNSAAFVLIGSFTSHVTGYVGRLANDIATPHPAAAVAALSMILSFFVGAFVASMIVESNLVGRTPIAYGLALSFEAALLITFIALTHLHGSPVRLHKVEESVLCMAMGAQNSLVTRLSGAVVRTTHLTGVVTDLGIESARWFRYWRSTLSHRLQLRLAFGRNPVERPQPAKLKLLATIPVAFGLGAVGGALTGSQLGAAAMWLPFMAVSLSVIYAFVTGRRRDDSVPGARSGGT